jgi:putative tryptophan/tyrosine transport system substrate-binding protein
MTDRRRFLLRAAATAVPAALARPSRAQATPRRVAFLSPFPRTDVDFFLGLLRSELAKLGWVDGRNVVVLEPRTTEGRTERLPTLAADIVAQAADVILVQSAPATRAAMQATASIPIVMVSVGNPIEYGIVSNYTKPGGNVTGTTFLADESILKLLQLVLQAVPGLHSVAIFANPTNEAAAPMIRMVRENAAARGIRLQIVEVSGPADFEPGFEAIRRERTESMLLPPEPLIRSRRDAVGEFALREKLPLAVVGQARYLPVGGLIGYSPAAAQYPELAARYIDQLFKGAKPGDLPIEQPTRFELTVNLKTARALGLTIPASILASADELIQ